MSFWRLVREDLKARARWYGVAWSGRTLLRMWLSDGFTAQLLYRCMQWCQAHRLGLLAFLLYRLNAVIGHCIIGRGASFGEGLVILHSIGIVVNTQVRAGKGLILEHGVTIGAEKDESPVLGDNVFIGAGAKVLGAVRIGSDVRIGANAVVLKDLPDGATAVGVPARVVRVYGERLDSAAPE